MPDNATSQQFALSIDDASPTRGGASLATTPCSPCRFAYADPPYLGLSARFYGELHEAAADYDDPEKHRELIERLCDEYPEGWVMHLHEPALREILPMTPSDCRVMAWVKGFASFKPTARHAQYAWEPVIVRGGRKRTESHCIRDWHKASIALKKGFRGAKPPEVVHWLMEVLNVQPQDTVDDLFPGSGAVTKAIESWKNQQRLF